MKKVIEVKNLRVSFKNKKKEINIIRGVDILLHEGEILGIVGESGSGKSVTSKSLLDVNLGAITKVDSIEILGNKTDEFEKMKWKKIRGREISYIPQNPQTSLNPSRKIYKQILDVIEETKDKYFEVEALNKKEKNIKINKKYRMSKIIELLEMFKIDNIKGVLNSYPHELSGGLKQRVIIAMSILTGAKIMIADEPTTA
ncbi:MAG: ABC transporter ATP-binding protein, partial [Mycoplasmataceae bacterium]|nr:ABC transporter ATP-binding protein [Mycoplasmataceae bacterium]